MALTVVVASVLVIVGALGIEIGRIGVPAGGVVAQVALAFVVVERVRLRDLRSNTRVAIVGSVGGARPARWSTHRSEDRGARDGGSRLRVSMGECCFKGAGAAGWKGMGWDARVRL